MQQHAELPKLGDVEGRVHQPRCTEGTREVPVRSTGQQDRQGGLAASNRVAGEDVPGEAPQHGALLDERKRLNRGVEGL